MNDNKMQKMANGFDSNDPEAMKSVEKLLDMSTNVLGLLKRQISAKDPEEAKKLQEEMMACRDALMVESEKICAQMGMTREEMEAYASNPSNFDPKQWEQMQSFKSEIDRTTKEMLKGPSRNNKVIAPAHKKWISA